jgi:DNA polymerase-3 subunit epsilon
LHPGLRNSLVAVFKGYDVDARTRVVQGALMVSELLANVYLAMTGGQTAMLLDDDATTVGAAPDRDPADGRLSRPGAAPTVDLPVTQASEEESAAHDALLEKIRKSGACVWDID